MVVHRPTEPYNREQARIYSIIKVLEAAGLGLHGERQDFFAAYRAEKARQKKINTGRTKAVRNEVP